MCAACLGEGYPETLTGSDPQQFIDKIYRCCGKKPGYMAPLAELVFRVLIAGGNAPMDAGEITSAIKNVRSQHVIKRIEIPVIAAILRADQYYGFIEADRSDDQCPT